MKTKETISFTLPIGSNEIIKEMAKNLCLNKSIMLEHILKGKIKIEEGEWEKYKFYLENKDKNT